MTPRMFVSNTTCQCLGSSSASGPMGPQNPPPPPPGRRFPRCANGISSFQVVDGVRDLAPHPNVRMRRKYFAAALLNFKLGRFEFAFRPGDQADLRLIIREAHCETFADAASRSGYDYS